LLQCCCEIRVGTICSSVTAFFRRFAG
jgi:hypothetical protein